MMHDSQQKEWQPEPVDTVWFIEAPGKANSLQALLRSLGHDVRVQATKGHFMTMPDMLTDTGIDENMHDFARAPKDPVLYRRIRAEARSARNVVIATDADMEGDVIAWDVAEVIRDIHPSPMRVKVRAMDADSIREAMEQALPVKKEDAIAGRARALVDRAIGSAMARKGLGAGRVSCGMLGLVVHGKVSTGRLTLTAEATDGGRPWKLTLPVKSPLTRDVARRLEGLPMPDMGIARSEPFSFSPGHMGDIMVRSSEVLGLKPAQTAAAMQTAYETGRLSYPRATSRGMTRAAARKMRKILGQGFDDRRVKEKAPSDVHDAPHPIGDFNPAHNPERLGEVEGVRTLIGRDLVRCGQRHMREYADTAPLKAFLTGKGIPAEVVTLLVKSEWFRESGPAYPGRENYVEQELIDITPEQALLEACMAAGLGKASTWSTHIESFLEKGLVTDRMELTAEGQTMAASLPQDLLNPRLSVAIEGICEKGASLTQDTPAGKEPWEHMAGKIVGSMPARISSAIRSVLSSPQPRVDHRRVMEPSGPENGAGIKQEAS